ncbi:Card1-like endonuclease domain-containing protein [Clostridium sp.]|uniref:Card1-like endonuclease domain-containing protein n=1 Tax=Clostridium sp. TaxID=1506 RepID=UPI0039952C02
MIDLLISIFDGHNEASILLTEEYKPKKILFFYLTNKDAYQLTKFKEYYKNKFPDVEFYYENFNIDNPREVEDIIIKYKANKNILNVTSGKKVALLMIYSLALKNSIECKYIDIEKELIIDFSDKAININKSSFVDLNIDDIVKSVGGSIIVDSTEVYNREAIINITYWIANNLEIWEEVKSDLQMNNVFIRDECNPEIMKIDKNILSKNKMEFYYRALNFLKNLEMIAYKNSDNFIKVYFLNDFIKSFIFKSGTWLEVLTKNIIDEIKEIDDIKSGLLFLWNDKQSKVKNELDVVAIKDSILICISCKDSKKYDERALNELNVYANQLGGENVKKILVATMAPAKPVVALRAKEMGINIVIFNGSIEGFKEELKSIILK